MQVTNCVTRMTRLTRGACSLVRYVRRSRPFSACLVNKVRCGGFNVNFSAQVACEVLREQVCGTGIWGGRGEGTGGRGTSS